MTAINLDTGGRSEARPRIHNESLIADLTVWTSTPRRDTSTIGIWQMSSS